MYNPIIPVCRSLPAAWRRDLKKRPSGYQLAMSYVRFFEPDVFVETEPGLARSIGIADNTQSRLFSRVLSFDDFVLGDDRYHDFKFGLNIFDVYEQLYHNEYKFLRRDDSLVALFHNCDCAYVDAVFGGFPKDKTLSYIQQKYIDVFNPAILKHEPSDWLKFANEHGLCPLKLTGYYLRKQFNNNGWGPTIFVANPTSPLDLLDLWNLRLIRKTVLPVNSEWLPDLKDYLHDFIVQNHRPLPRNPHGAMIRTTVEIGNSFSEEEANHLVHNMVTGLPQGSLSTKFWYDPIWENHHDDAFAPLLPVEILARSSNLDLSISEGGRPSIKFQSLTPEFASEYGGGNVRWVNVVSLRDFQDKYRFALVLPSALASCSYDHLRTPGPLLVSREGFVLPQRYKHLQEYIGLLSGTKAIVGWFKQNGISAKVSDAGRVADQILLSVDGFRGIQILQNKDTLQLLDKMSKSTRLLGEDTIEEYPDRTCSVSDWEALMKRREKNNLMGKNYLDRLVETGALKLGLSVSCPNCQKKNWYGLNDLAEKVLCERCLKEFNFPQGNSKKPQWKYRVAGPYSVPNYAGGSYATVLALNCIAHKLGPYQNSTITFSTNLDLEVNGKSLEIDFACWFQRKGYMDRQAEPIFLVGEAKSFAENSFSKDDIARLKQVGQKMPSTFLIFATLKLELSPEERSQIGKLAIWGRLPDASGSPRNPVIVLTGTELLESLPFGISEAWKKTGGKRQNLVKPAYLKMDNLWTLADITQQAYLGLQPMSEWLHEYWKHRYKRQSQR